eukprot:g1868.t1
MADSKKEIAEPEKKKVESTTPSSPKKEKREKQPWENAEGIKEVADILLGNNGLKVREGVELGKRVHYFKGSKLTEFLLTNESSAKARPKVDDKKEAHRVGKMLLKFQLIHKSERNKENKKLLNPLTGNQDWDDKAYYTWIYQGSQTFNHFMTGLLIISFLAVTCFPIWPKWMKVAIWYCSVTILIIFFIISVIRLIVAAIFWIFGVEFWILPRLFDESITFAQSFVPLYSYEKVSSEDSWYYRLGLAVSFISFTVWMMNQPSEFDEFMMASRKFTDDLYSGNLLPDRSQQSKDNIDKVKIPDLDELMAEQEENPFPDEQSEEDLVDKFMEEKFFSGDKVNEEEDEDGVDEDKEEDDSGKGEGSAEGADEDGEARGDK